MTVEQFQQMGYKKETAELTPEALTSAYYETHWEAPKIEPVDGYNERRPVRTAFSPIQGVGGTRSAKVSGTFSPNPSGTDGVAPFWYDLLSAAGATIATDVATFGAAVASSALVGSSCTFRHRDGAKERVSAGTRLAKLSFKAENGGLWRAEVEGIGRYSDGPQAAFVSGVVPSGVLGSVFIGSGATVGAASAFSELEIAIENTISMTPSTDDESGYGAFVITGQKLMLRGVALDDGSVDFESKFRNAGAGDLLDVQIPMSAGSVGRILSWTGFVMLSEQPTRSYEDGLGYYSFTAEFFTAGAGAALTCTQS